MMGFWISIAMLCLTGFIQTFIPYMMKRTVVFGVTIPPPHIHHEIVKQAKKTYSSAMAVIWLVLLVGYSVWIWSNNQNDNLQVIIGMMIMLLYILISMLFYTYFHFKLQKEKQQKQWGANLTEVRIANASLNGQDEMLPLFYFISLAFVPLILIIYTYDQYSLLPEQIPTHWGPSGKPDAFTSKNHFSVISLPLIIIILQFMFAAMSEGTRRSEIKTSVHNIQKSTYSQVQKRKYTSRYLFLISFLITVLFSFLQLTTIHHGIIGQNILLTTFIVFIVIIIVGSIIFSIKFSNLEKDINPSNSQGSVTDIDDDHYWKGGLLYFNKEDPSLFVEKRFGIGWTMNFAQPISYIILFAPLFLILLIAYFS